MTYKKFIVLFFALPFILIGTIFTLNVIVDPFGITDYNILNIKYKFARDDRTEKVERIRKIGYINNLILGSSRSQHLDPKILTEYLGGYSYNFGVGGGNSADALGILLYLEKEDKLPSNVLLTLDFSLRDGIHPSFYKLPELNFLNKEMKPISQIAKFLSIDAIRATYKTLKAHIRHDTPNSYFDSEGFMVSRTLKQINPDIITQQCYTYINTVTKSNDVTLSKERFAYVKSIVQLCQKHNINLVVTLTPVYSYQYQLMKNDKNLFKQLNQFKSELADITPFYDAMIENDYVNDIRYFEDNVHSNEKYGALYLASLYKGMYPELTTYYRSDKSH